MNSTNKEKYITLWQDWIQALENNSLLDEHNKKHLLLSGITTSEFQKMTLFNLPQEIIDLYSIHNINPHIAEWTFAIDDLGFFDLLGFEDIALEWGKLQDLNEDSQEMLEDDEDYFGHCDQEINAFGYYARPEWIPIATDRQGNYLLIDLVPTNLGKQGQIIELSNESWDRRVVAKSIYELIEKKINQLNSNLQN